MNRYERPESPVALVHEHTGQRPGKNRQHAPAVIDVVGDPHEHPDGYDSGRLQPVLLESPHQEAKDDDLLDYSGREGSDYPDDGEVGRQDLARRRDRLDVYG